MPYIQVENGKVVGLFAQPQTEYAEQWAEDNDALVVDFINSQIRMAKDSTVVSSFQAQAAMAMAKNAGITTFDLLEAVQTAIESSGDVMAKLAWEKATEFRRNSPTITAIASAIGLTTEQTDNLFDLALSIQA